MNAERGFTLPELLVSFAIASILLALAVPSYRTLTASNRLSSFANNYVMALTEARMEAIRRNRSAQFCGLTGNGSDTLGAGCGTAAGAVKSLTGSNALNNVLANPTTPAGLTIARAVGIRYSGQGQGRLATGTGPYSGLVADISSNQLSTRNRRCIYLVTGSSVTTCAVTSSSTCPTNEPVPCQ